MKEHFNKKVKLTYDEYYYLILNKVIMEREARNLDVKSKLRP